MDLEEAEDLARKLMHQWLDDRPEHWRFRWSRATQSLGACYTNPDTGVYAIELSKPLTEINDRALAEGTILHEIAHAIAGHDAGHGPLWRETARRVGIPNPERCPDASEINTVPPKPLPPPKWAARCGTCETTYTLQRMTPSARRGRHICGRHSPSTVLHFQAIR